MKLQKIIVHLLNLGVIISGITKQSLPHCGIARLGYNICIAADNKMK